MDAQTFQSEMLKARTLSKLEHHDYWHGYERGLRRGYHGESFGTEQEHELWLTFAADGSDHMRRELGRGDRDGLVATEAESTA